jgi:hypothetical protein
MDEQQRWRVILEGTCAEALALVEPAELVSHARAGAARPSRKRLLQSMP